MSSSPISSEIARNALQIWPRIGRISDRCDWNSFSIPDLLSFVRVAFPLRPPEIFGHRKRYDFCASKGNESLRYLRMVAVTAGGNNGRSQGLFNTSH